MVNMWFIASVNGGSALLGSDLNKCNETVENGQYEPCLLRILRVVVASLHFVETIAQSLDQHDGRHRTAAACSSKDH